MSGVIDGDPIGPAPIFGPVGVLPGVGQAQALPGPVGPVDDSPGPSAPGSGYGPVGPISPEVPPIVIATPLMIFRAHVEGLVSLGSDVATIIPWDTVDVNVGHDGAALFDVSDPRYIVARYAGWYDIVLLVYLIGDPGALVVGKAFKMGFERNGGLNAQDFISELDVQLSLVDQGGTIPGKTYLAVGDYIDAFVLQSSGVSMVLDSNGFTTIKASFLGNP